MANIILFSLTNATTVLLWEPESRNPYGHATIQTGIYHMSLWPDGDVKNDYGTVNTYMNGITGSLVYHHNLDYLLEGKREPKRYPLENISTSSINAAYEEMLNYNDITPDRVTLEEGGKKCEERKRPEITLSNTRYTFKGVNYEEEEFYKFPQSCTSFSLSILRRGGFTYNQGLLLHRSIYETTYTPLRPRGILSPSNFIADTFISEIANLTISEQTGVVGESSIITVPNFEKCIVAYTHLDTQEQNKNSNCCIF